MSHSIPDRRADSLPPGARAPTRAGTASDSGGMVGCPTCVRDAIIVCHPVQLRSITLKPATQTGKHTSTVHRAAAPPPPTKTAPEPRRVIPSLTAAPPDHPSRPTEGPAHQLARAQQATVEVWSGDQLPCRRLSAFPLGPTPDSGVTLGHRGATADPSTAIAAVPSPGANSC